MINKKAFSFIEIIITVSIITLLAIVGYNANESYNQKTYNTKVLSDLSTIKNSLSSQFQENKSLPMPDGNNNFYASDTSYVHSYDDAFGVYGNITENTLAKKYLDQIPLDPRNNSYYSYGKTKDSNEFEIAGVQIIDTIATTSLVGNYKSDGGTKSLIREYNGPNFVYNGSTLNLPYNPDELILIARDINGTIYREGDTITTGPSETKEIYFSDGSVSVIEENTTLILNKLNFPSDSNLQTAINLTLEAGTIWTKATKLDEGSEFKVYTSDTAAAVRGTIFGVSKNSSEVQNILVEGEVQLFQIYPGTANGTENRESPLYISGATTSEDNQGIIKVEKGGEAIIITTPISETQGSISTKDTTDISSLDIIDLTSIEQNTNIENLSESDCLRLVEGICFDEIADENLIAEGYKLVGYAPLTETEKLYSDIMEINSSFLGEIIPNEGVYISDGDYLKYDGLNLSSEFVIEMEVDSLIFQSTSNKYLFDVDGNGLLFGTNTNNNSYIIKYGGELICSDCNINFTNNITEKVQIKNGNKIIIGESEFIIRNKIQISDYLYIGTKYDSSLGINSFIKNLKIYNK